MRNPHRIAAFQGGPSRQRGMVATLIALVVLIVTLFAVIALMRSVDTSNTIAGSLVFRQAVLQEAERAYTEAKALGVYTPPISNADNAALGYYSSVQAPSEVRADLPKVLYDASDANNWVGTKQLVYGTTVWGNQVHYVVERLCPLPNVDATLSSCIVPGKAITGGTSSNTTSDPGVPFNTTGSAAAFRLSVRVNGPKNSVAFVQTILR
jgi:type IV pilus assembly protein PilX